MQHHFTHDELMFIIQHGRENSLKDLTELFNRRFKLELKKKQISSCIKNHKIYTGRTGYFQKGHIPYNKGTHTCALGCEKTQFRPEHMPVNHRPVGSERINVDGYTEIKVAEPNKWRPKHIEIWEAANGPVPKGYVLIFGDSNKLNVTLDNLILVTRKQLARLNQNGLIQQNIDLTRSGIIIADIISKCSERKKNAK